MTWHLAYAPATIANVGPGFDVLGMAIHHKAALGDKCAVRLGRGDVRVSVLGDGGRLPTTPERNVASVAALRVMSMAGESRGFELRLTKGLPLGSGLGSSAASAASAALAMNDALGRPFTLEQLVPAARAGEALAAGTPHPDNVVPALLGGVSLIIDVQPERGADGELVIARLPRPRCAVVLAMPDLEVPTAEARRAIPRQIPHGDAVFSAGRLALLVASLYERRTDWLKHAVLDRLHQPYRIPLIRGFEAARDHALTAGALAVGVSGSGPATFALVDHGADAERVANALRSGFLSAGVNARAAVTQIAPERREVRR